MFPCLKVDEPDKDIPWASSSSGREQKRWVRGSPGALSNSKTESKEGMKLTKRSRREEDSRLPINLVPWRLLEIFQGQLVWTRSSWHGGSWGEQGRWEDRGHYQLHCVGGPFYGGAMISWAGPYDKHWFFPISVLETLLQSLGVHRSLQASLRAYLEGVCRK